VEDWDPIFEDSEEKFDNGESVWMFDALLHGQGSSRVWTGWLAYSSFYKSSCGGLVCSLLEVSIFSSPSKIGDQRGFDVWNEHHGSFVVVTFHVFRQVAFLSN
jgi:hypothetical protein